MSYNRFHSSNFLSYSCLQFTVLPFCLTLKLFKRTGANTSFSAKHNWMFSSVSKGINTLSFKRQCQRQRHHPIIIHCDVPKSAPGPFPSVTIDPMEPRNMILTDETELSLCIFTASNTNTHLYYHNEKQNAFFVVDLFLVKNTNFTHFCSEWHFFYTIPCSTSI